MKITLKELRDLDFDKDLKIKALKEVGEENLFKVIVHMGKKRAVFRYVFADGNSWQMEDSKEGEAERKIHSMLCGIVDAYIENYHDGHDKHEELMPMPILEFKTHFWHK